MFKFIIATDIEQMYRQILVSPEDRRYQLILWRDTPESSLQAFQLNTVTYGLTPSPFLAIRTLQQLVNDEGSQHPLASDIILNNTFVDDIIFGSDDVEDLLFKRQDLENLLAKGQFRLKKWKANKPELLAGLPFDRLETSFDIPTDLSTSTKLLGIRWNHPTDNFYYSFTSSSVVSTKRQLLSQIARLFDPIGWLSPLVIKAKLIMQSLCQSGPGWDDPIPDQIKTLWHEYCLDVVGICNLEIPRHAHLLNSFMPSETPATVHMDLRFT